MTARRRLLGALVALVAVAPPALAGAAAPVPTGTARLQGTFLLQGTVTTAVDVSGEHRGQIVMRHWTFTPGCASGQCPTETLTRPRAGGTDTLVLHRHAPGYYIGYSNFFRSVRCGARLYRPGERIPFRITVRITQALVSGGEVVASRINASYRNQVRYNLTPCVAYFGHDAASYHGHIVP